jgi:polysaccharide biosynthesis protein PslH
MRIWMVTPMPQQPQAPVRTGGGMRMKVLHSLAVGKAVVTTQRGAEGLDIWGEPPPLEFADEAEGFAWAVSALLDEPQRRADLGQRARRFVMEHFSPQAYAQRIEQIYGRMTGRSKRFEEGGPYLEKSGKFYGKRIFLG